MESPPCIAALWINDIMRAKDYRRTHKGKGKKSKPRQCWFCKKLIPPHLVSRDHIVPKSRGGTNAGWNLRWACKPCNEARGAADPETMVSAYQYRIPRSRRAR